MKLNYRDKVILGIVLAIAIFVAGYFALIKPKRQAIKDNKATLEDVQDQQDEIKRKIARIEPIKTNINETFDKADKITKIFVPKEDIDKTTLLDQFMAGYAQDANIKVMDLKVDDTATSALGYYYKPYTEVATSLRQEADINGSLQQKYEEASKESTLVSGRAVETVMSTRYGLEVRGTLKDVFTYLDTIRDIDQAIIVTSFGYEKYVPTDDEEATKPAAPAEGDEATPPDELAPDDSNSKDDADKDRTISEDDVVDASIVIQLYSIYNMDKPVVDDIPVPAE